MRFCSLSLFVWLAAATSTFAADPAPSTTPAKPKPPEHPFTPGGVYRAGDMKRPRPSVITPPTESSQEKPGTPPSDALVLFDGKDFAHWTRDIPKNDPDPNDAAPKWKIEDGCAVCTPKSGTLKCKDKWGSAQLHVEWATPSKVEGNSQGRGNSGILTTLFGEVQVLDSYDNDTYPDGQAAALYNKYPPLVNASRKPGEWQTYDIIGQCAVIKDGQVVTPAMITVIHNGLVVHHAIVFDNKAQDWTFALQDHHNPVRFRNIWVRPLHQYDENPAPEEKK
jgi:hypothetical protein